jgi:putative nucleotidyltransferase with HDIG domain
MLNNILVIDDEMVICELLETLLKDQGFSVTTALSGEEGIKKFKEGTYGLVMTDLKLPDLDGIKVLEQIKKHNPDTVVIVMTGYPSFETVHSALRQGAFDYVPKPFTIDEISFAVRRALAFRNLKETNNQLMRELAEQNSRLEEKAKERTQELRLLYKIGSDISSTLNLSEVLSIILDRISGILNVEICSILLLDETNKDYIMKCAKGLDNAVVCKTRVRVGESISGWVIEHKEGLLVENIETDPRFQHRNDEKYYTRSFISVPLLSKDRVIGVINVNNKKSKDIFTKDDYRFIKGVAAEATIGIENARLYQSLEDSYMRTVLVLTSAIDAKDHYTNKHSQHVCEYASAVAKELNLSEEEIKNLERACKLHDIGKIGIEDTILTKPDKLTPEEWNKMKTHPSKSAEILRPLAFLNEVIKLVEQHHERYDGTGYPSSKKAEEITLGARIITVVDSFDAMFTDRPYRKALTKEAAIEELKKGSGTQFDPKVVEVFLRVLEQSLSSQSGI